MFDFVFETLLLLRIQRDNLLRQQEFLQAEARRRRLAQDIVDRGHFYPVRNERLTPIDATMSDHRPMDESDL